MNTNPDSKPFAVITGASRGIGAAYARALAAKGYDLLLVAREIERLTTLATELSHTYRLNVDVKSLDLTQPDAAHALFTDCGPRVVDVLVNNAGFGFFGRFIDMPPPRIQEMLTLHINTVVESIRLFLPSMLERRSGAIINVASIAGLFPVPYLAEYSATKAFLITFSEALAEEVREYGVRIQACCPGHTQTDFHATAGVQSRSPFGAQSPEQVVQTSLQALSQSPPVITIGWQGTVSAWLAKWVPHSFLMRAAAKRTKPPAFP